MSTLQQSFPSRPSAAVASSETGRSGLPQPGRPSLIALLRLADAPQANATFTLARALFHALQFRMVDDVRAAYGPDAVLEHPVLGTLAGLEIERHWAMFLKRTPDFTLDFTITRVAGPTARIEWSACYRFFDTGRSIRIAGSTVLTFRDGLVMRHEERFDRRAWSHQALGLSGLLLTWLPGSRGFLRHEARRAFGIDGPRS